MRDGEREGEREDLCALQAAPGDAAGAGAVAVAAEGHVHDRGGLIRGEHLARAPLRHQVHLRHRRQSGTSTTTCPYACPCPCLFLLSSSSSSPLLSSSSPLLLSSPPLLLRSHAHCTLHMLELVPLVSAGADRARRLERDQLVLQLLPVLRVTLAQSARRQRRRRHAGTRTPFFLVRALTFMLTHSHAHTSISIQLLETRQSSALMLRQLSSMSMLLYRL